MPNRPIPILRKTERPILAKRRGERGKGTMGGNGSPETERTTKWALKTTLIEKPQKIKWERKNQR